MAHMQHITSNELKAQQRKAGAGAQGQGRGEAESGRGAEIETAESAACHSIEEVSQMKYKLADTDLIPVEAGDLRHIIRRLEINGWPGTIQELRRKYPDAFAGAPSRRNGRT